MFLKKKSIANCNTELDWIINLILISEWYLILSPPPFPSNNANRYLAGIQGHFKHCCISGKSLVELNSWWLRPKSAIFAKMHRTLRAGKKSFSNFSCVFLNPNNFFPICIIIVLIYYIWEISRNKLKRILLPKIVLTFHCLNKLFSWSQIFCKFSAFSFSRSLEQCFLTEGQNNFGNKIPFLCNHYLLHKGKFN